jgi:hypothetical protein
MPGTTLLRKHNPTGLPNQIWPEPVRTTNGHTELHYAHCDHHLLSTSVRTSRRLVSKRSLRLQLRTRQKSNM